MSGFFDALKDMFKPVRLKVLIADDSALQVSVAKSMLAELGHYSVATEKAEEILRLTLDENPDLILIDMNMGSMSGTDVLEVLKMDPKTASVPVIVCTCEQAEVTMRAAKQLGAVAYVQKPLRLQALKELLAPIERTKRSARG